MKIDKNTTLDKLLKNKKTAAVLAKHQVPCLGCSMAAFEMGELKLGDITKIYRLNLKAILKDFNKI